MFIAFIGLQNAGVVINNPSTCVSLGDVKTVPVALALIGTIITLVLVTQKGKGRTSGWYPDYMDSGYHLPACRGLCG